MPLLNSEKVRQVFFLGLIILLGFTIIMESQQFIPAVLGAITFYVLSRKTQFYLTEQKKWRSGAAAVFIIICSFLVILVPLFFVGNLLYEKLAYVAHNSTAISKGFASISHEIKSLTKVDIASSDVIGKFQNWATNFLAGFIGGTFNIISNIGVMYFMLYFMLADARLMERYLSLIIPLKYENVEKLGTEIQNMVVSNALGIPLLAVIQALFALVGYLIFAVPDTLLWAVITGLAAMLPIVGTPIVWIPIAVYLYASGEKTMGIGLLIYGLVVILNVDNIFRMIVQKKLADVHPLITVFGVIVGLNLFGFIGLIFGPLMISMFLLLIRIYNSEFMKD